MAASRRTWALPVLCLLLALALPLPARADTGPKPSVKIEFTGSTGQPYYATLLSRESSTGPQSTYNPDYPESAQYPEGQKDIWQAFVDYEDPDGFYFLQWFWECTQTDLLDWNYRPPQAFKVLVFYPETGEYRASGIYERYAFDSYFTVDLSQPGELLAEKSYDFLGEIVSLALRAAITILIELGIAPLFGYRKKAQLGYLLQVNLVTQLLLNLLLNWANFQWGPCVFVPFFFNTSALVYMALEVGVCCLEAWAYRRGLPSRGTCTWTRPRPVAYAWAANLASFLAGLCLARVVPGIFSKRTGNLHRLCKDESPFNRLASRCPPLPARPNSKKTPPHAGSRASVRGCFLQIASCAHQQALAISSGQMPSSASCRWGKSSPREAPRSQSWGRCTHSRTQNTQSSRRWTCQTCALGADTWGNAWGTPRPAAPHSSDTS